MGKEANLPAKLKETLVVFIKQSRKTDCEFRTRNRKNEKSIGEKLNLHIYLDHSILEVYANSRQYIPSYPIRSDSVGISLFSSGGPVNVKTIQAWDMAPADN